MNAKQYLDKTKYIGIGRNESHVSFISANSQEFILSEEGD